MLSLHETSSNIDNQGQLFEVMYQTLSRVFDHVSKHRKRKLKNEAKPSFLTKVQGVWKCDQTLV